MCIWYSIKRKILTKKVIKRNQERTLWILKCSKFYSIDEVVKMCERCNTIWKWYDKHK